MMQKKLGIALPVYNGADYLAQALDSILAQDYADFDLYVSDNASTDSTPAILAQYAAADARVHVSRSDTFLKQAANANRAVEICETTWVKLFCHDDIMRPDCLSSTLNTIEQCADERVALIADAPAWLFANGYEYTPYENDAEQPRYWSGTDYMKRLLHGGSVDPLPSLTTATVRRDVFMVSPRFDPQYMHFDTFYWSELLIQWNFVFIPRMLTLTRIHGAQVHVDAHKTLGTVRDVSHFWPKYVEQYGDVLRLTDSERFRTRLKPLAAAGTITAIQLIKGNINAAARIMFRLPPLWWPLMPIFALRTYRNERRKIAALRDKVPIDAIYP